MHMLDAVKFPWKLLERLVNALENKQTITGGVTSSTGSKKSTSVGELPPEVIAPSLKSMRKSSGFGSSSCDS